MERRALALGGASTGFRAASRNAWARMGDAWRARAGEDARGAGEAPRLPLFSDRAPPATLEAPQGAAAESMPPASCVLRETPPTPGSKGNRRRVAAKALPRETCRYPSQSGSALASSETLETRQSRGLQPLLHSTA